MKHILKNISIFLMLLMTTVAFSQPNPDDAGDGVDPQDTQAPINSNLVLLAAAGVGICYYQFKKKVKTV